MRIEVEQKFATVDLEGVARKLSAWGTPPGVPRQEVDLYFRHPSRDFARTDEALRIRRAGPDCSVAYKGPKLDTTTKTRREIELSLPGGDQTGAAWRELLEALGFQPVAEVRKRRRKAIVKRNDWEVEVSLDEVEGVGTYVELELIASAEKVAAAKSCISALAGELGLSRGERRSYLELLLAQG